MRARTCVCINKDALFHRSVNSQEYKVAVVRMIVKTLNGDESALVYSLLLF